MSATDDPRGHKADDAPSMGLDAIRGGSRTRVEWDGYTHRFCFECEAKTHQRPHAIEVSLSSRGRARVFRETKCLRCGEVQL